MTPRRAIPPRLGEARPEGGAGPGPRGPGGHLKSRPERGAGGEMSGPSLHASVWSEYFEDETLSLPATPTPCPPNFLEP